MKSKISIWDCRRAIEIAGGLPLAIRGDLFAEPGPDPVARWISETVLVTQLEVKQGRWVIGNQCCPGKVAPSDGKSRPLNVLWPVLPGNDLKSRGRKWSPERSIRTRHNEG